MKVDKGRGTSNGEIQLAELESCKIRSNTDEGEKLLGTDSSSNQLKRGWRYVRWLPAVALLFVLSLWQVFKHSETSQTTIAISERTFVLPPIFQNSVINNKKDYQIQGSFSESLCKRSPITVTTNFGSPFQHSQILTECSFQLTQKGKTQKMAYSQDGILNVVDLSSEIFLSEQFLDLGLLPLLSGDKIISRKFRVFDLMTGLPITNFKTILKSNRKDESVSTTESAEPEVVLTFSNGYYTGYIDAEGYRQATIGTSDLLKFEVQNVYLVKSDAPQTLIALRDTQNNRVGLRVDFQSEEGKFTVDHKVGGQKTVLFISRPLVDEKMSEFVLFDNAPGLQSNPDVFLKNKKVHSGRVLAEEPAPAGAEEKSEPVESSDIEISSSESSQKIDWMSGKAKKKAWDTTVQVNTVMSNYLIFSPNITCIRPTVLLNQELSAVKVKGAGDTFWYVISYNQTQFVIVTDGKNHPAEIRLPSGVVVQILSKRGRWLSQHKDVFAIVTDSKGNYFNIADNTWERISTIDVTPYHLKLPNPEFLTSNIVNIGADLHGQMLIRQGLLFSDSKELTDLLHLLSSKTVDKIHGKMYSSQKGYKLVELPSYTNKGQKDTYRVCIYCLKREVKRAQFQYQLKDKLVNADTVKFYDFDKNADLMEAFFHQTYHTAPHNNYIDNEARAVTEVWVQNEVGEFKVLSKDDLEKIYGLQSSNKLKNVWLREVGLERLQKRHYKSPLVVRQDKLYSLDRRIVSEFVMEDADTFEPELFGVLDAKTTGKNYGLDGIFVEDAVIYQMWFQARSIPGIFIKSTHKDALEAWPFVLRKEDTVISRYHINVAMLRKVYNLQPSTVENYNSEPVANKEAEELLQKYKPIITRENENGDLLANKHIIFFNNKQIELSDTCMQDFFKINVPGAFRKVEKATYRLRNNKFYIKFGEQIYIYSFDPMKHRLLNDQYTDAAQNLTVHRCLQMDIVSTDPNLLRTIWVTEDQIFEGYCQGQFINDKVCKGTFRGKYKTECKKEADEIVKCCNNIKNFTCEGSTTAEGCNDKYLQNFKLNETDTELVSKGVYSVIGDTITNPTDITGKSETVSVDIHCQDSFSVKSNDCTKATVKISENEIDHKNVTVYCEGTLNLNNIECKTGKFNLYFCEQEQPVQSEDSCKGNFLKRHCENGGNFQRCFTKDAGNKEQLCTGGIWDGNTCKERPVYIITDKKRYLTGKCDGTYLPNKACIGTFDAQVIECEQDVTPENLCQTEPKDKFICTGSTSPLGCVGSLRANTTVNEKPFLIILSDQENPITSNKSTEEGVASLYYTKPAEETHIRDIKVECKAGYNDLTKKCKNAKYEILYKEDVASKKETITCEGTLDLVTLKCEGGNFYHTECLTKYPNIAAPVCNGTFSSRLCVNGGDSSACSERSKFNQKLTCKGLWNGRSCRERPLYIILNNAAYVTGECTGTYLENEKCEGQMKGKVVLCNIELTPDNLCDGPVVDEFFCDGTLTKAGCNGHYTGSATLRNAILNLETKENTIVGLNKEVANGKVKFEFSKNDEDYEKLYGKTTEYQWQDVHSECENSFSDEKKTCGHSKFGGVMKYEVNKTYIEVSCDGNLEMYPIICDSGAYTIKYCNTTIEPYDSSVCNGTYTELSCSNGGNLTSCFGEDKPLVNIFCNGTYKDSHCDGFVPPSFSIIKVNETHWLQGFCSNRIQDNSCTGIFDKAKFVQCSGDPLNNQQDYDACTAIPGETFGSCDGTLDSSGCHGNYLHPVDIDSRTFFAKCSSDENKVYNFQTFACKVNFESKQNDEIDIQCEEGFNPKSKACPKGQGSLLIRHYAKEKPGVLLKRSVKCFETSLSLKNFECKSKFEVTTCIGKPITKEDKSVTCLGNFIKASCDKGGNQNGCKGNSKSNLELFCVNSFFNGNECVSDLFSENTAIKIHPQEATQILDEYERPVRIAEFVVDGFSMVNAESSSFDSKNAVIKSVRFEQAEQQPDGTIDNIKAFENIKTPITLDEGRLVKMIFKNLLFDRLHYTQFANDDSCKLVHIKFTELIIKNTLFQDFVTHNSVIRNLQWGESSTPDFGAEEFKADIGFGTIVLRDVDIYLPYISKNQIKEWMKPNSGKLAISIVIPKIPTIKVPEYKIHFDNINSEIYLEFPEFIIEDKSIDLIYLSDYVLDSTTLKSKPEIVSGVLEGYTEDTRIAILEKNSEASILSISETLN